MGKVIEGAYKGWLVFPRKRFWIFGKTRPAIVRFPFDKPLTASRIKKWQLVTESTDKDSVSMALRGLGGWMLFGGLGALGGAATAKSEGAIVAIEFKNGKKSLIQMEKSLYAQFCFLANSQVGNIGQPNSQASAIAPSNAQETAPDVMGEKSKYFTFVLSLLIIGCIGGIHRIYVGRTWSGLLQLCTIGGLFVWQIMDMISIGKGTFQDGAGREVR